MVCRLPALIVAPRFFDGLRGFTNRTHSNAPISGVATKDKHIHAWLLRTPRLVGQVVAFIEAADHARGSGAQPAQ